MGLKDFFTVLDKKSFNIFKKLILALMSWKNCFRVGRQCLNIFKKLVSFSSFVLLSYNTCWPQPSLPPILSVFPCTPTLPQIDSSFISIQKGVYLPRISTEQSIAKCNKVGINPHIKIGQGNPVEGKRYKNYSKWSEIPHSHCLVSHKKNTSQFTTIAGSMIATLRASMSP